MVQRQSSHFQQYVLPADAIVSKQQAEFNLKHKLCIPDLQELLNKAQKTNSWGKRYRRWDREPKRNRYLMVKSKWKLFFLFRKQPKKKINMLLYLQQSDAFIYIVLMETISVLFFTISFLSCWKWQRIAFLKKATQGDNCPSLHGRACSSHSLSCSFMGYLAESRSCFKADTTEIRRGYATSLTKSLSYLSSK